MGNVFRAVACLFACIFAFLASDAAHAQGIGSDTKTMSVSVAIVNRGEILKTKDLDFGMIAASATAGTVVVSPAGTRTSTGGVTLVGPQFSEAEFTGRGTRNQQVQIFVSPVPLFIRRAGGTETMRVDLFTTSVASALGLARVGAVNAGRYRLTNTTGIFSFPVGARLSVGANQAKGAYSGEFTVEVIFQ